MFRERLLGVSVTRGSAAPRGRDRGARGSRMTCVVPSRYGVLSCRCTSPCTSARAVPRRRLAGSCSGRAARASCAPPPRSRCWIERQIAVLQVAHEQPGLPRESGGPDNMSFDRPVDDPEHARQHGRVARGEKRRVMWRFEKYHRSASWSCLMVNFERDRVWGILQGHELVLAIRMGSGIAKRERESF